MQDPLPDPSAGAAPRPPKRPPGSAAAPCPPLDVAALLDAHGAEIYRHLRRLSPTAEDAADLHQETFLRAFRALPSLPADANHRAWLHRIAANAAADAHRRRTVRAAAALAPVSAASGVSGAGLPSSAGRSARSSTRDDTPPAGAGPEPMADGTVDPAARAEAAELRSAVRGALTDLPWRERTAVVARVLDGRDYADVAALLDCSEANARQLVSRGIRRVRTALSPYLEIDR